MKRSLAGAVAALAAMVAASPALASNAFAGDPGMNSPSASVAIHTTYPEPPGTEHLHFAAGPYTVHPGANLILTQLNEVPKPDVNGYMIRMAPNLRYALPDGKCCGKVPLVDVIHLHHGVWLTDGQAGAGEGNSYGGAFYPFMAAGEEKTTYEFPPGYGYPIGAKDNWVLNYMIHNLWDNSAKVYITYDIDFLPDSAPAARGMTAVHPIWMDVEDHHLYPVFNVQRYSGKNGKFTFPDMATNPYPAPAASPGHHSYAGSLGPLNEFTVDHAGTLIATAGHLHPGGLYDDLDLIRPGATIASKAIRGTVPDSVRLFRSYAHYFDPRGPISWDLAMTGTPESWRPHVEAGDIMRISATYDTTHASWYEVMGIMVVWEAWDDQAGLDPFTGAINHPIASAASVNPFTHALNETGYITHPHLTENGSSTYGGNYTWLTVNPNSVPSCKTSTVTIESFTYVPGDLDHKNPHRCAPTVKEGQTLTFVNDDASALTGVGTVPGSGVGVQLNPSAGYLATIFHTVTSCQNPCGLNTGISYPLANGSGGAFDSGELGYGAPGVGRVSWSTPTNLPPGTYTFYCRIHPWMRGVFRIIS